jgi:NAD(P)-dependent dehydrogenase (short-subunit alcohol dehydrogenase family)
VHDLSGRVVIVAHADTHEGAAVARAVCDAGAAAILTGDAFAALGSLAAELHGDTGAPVAVFAGDLLQDEHRRSLAAMVSELFPV